MPLAIFSPSFKDPPKNRRHDPVTHVMEVTDNI
nr:hypothetical protein [uncultured archaeon]